MAVYAHRDDSKAEEEIYDEGDAFDEDMETLRRVCMLTGTKPNEIEAADTDSGSEGESSEMDDLELVRNIQQRFSLPSDANPPLFLKPLSSLPPIVSDDDEDDFETLRVIERRFSKYDSDALKKKTANHLNEQPELVHGISIASEQETPNILYVDRNYGEASGEEFPDSEEACNTSQPLESFSDTGHGKPLSGFIERRSEVSESSMLPLKYSSFPNPKSAQVFIDAIKKNRSCQKFIRSKLIQVEARIEENKKLKERIKVLKDFQLSCKKRAGRALSQKKDARVQLISVRKSNLKVNDKKVRALYFGPAENSHAANYRMVLTKFPLSLGRQRWSKVEKENLEKGIKQQFQEMLLQKSVEVYRDYEESSDDPTAFDEIISSITDLEITPENVRSFLPKVDWERLASMHVVGRSGTECEARWLNSEDPLINHNSWTNNEDKKFLFILQQRGLFNWIDIAITLGTNRTPYQCLARYQRSLNALIMKRDWTEDDDAQLRVAVEAFGESDWQLIASNLVGRTGTQCSNRWRKTLHPSRKRVGRWTVDEDKRLKVAVMLFGPKTWKKIAQFVLGRTQVQCRERWVNVLDPSLNLEEWTKEEDSRLKAAITEHGHCWSKVAASVPPRTDSQCRRRWKVLLPHEVPLLQEARKIQKAAFISNFVDRESERPALGPSDFLPLPGINPIPEAENGSNSGKEKKKSRERPNCKKQKDMVSCDVRKKISSKRSKIKAQICPEKVLRITNSDDVETLDGDDTASKKKAAKTSKLPPKRYKCTGPAAGHQKLPFTPEHSSFLGVTNGDDVENFDENDTTSKKKKRTPKPHSKKNKCIEPAQDHQDVSLSPENLTLVRINNGDDIETFGGDNTTQKKKRKASKSRSKSLEFIKKDDQAASSLGGKRRKKAPELFFERESFVQDQEDPQLPGHSGLEILDVGDASLHGMSVREDAPQLGSSRKARSRDKISSTTADCDKKKQKHRASLHGNDVSTDSSQPSETISLRRVKQKLQRSSAITSKSFDAFGCEFGEEQHERHVVNGVPTLTQDCETQTCWNSGMTKIMTSHDTQSSQPGNILAIVTVGNVHAGKDLEGRIVCPYETVDEVASINPERSCGADDDCAFSPTSNSSPHPVFGGHTNGALDVAFHMEVETVEPTH